MNLENITFYIVVPFVAWVCAQVIKFSISVVKGKADYKQLYVSGGMPSAHAAVVTCLVTWALLDAGISSPLFGISAVFAVIVIYDSIGVRRSTGEQAKQMNLLVADLVKGGSVREASKYKNLREVLGHTPHEVFVGIILGAVVACLFAYQKFAGFQAYVISPVDTTVGVKVVFGLSIGLLVCSIIMFLVLRAIIENRKAAKLQNVRILIVNVIAAAIVGLYGFSIRENAYPISIKLWAPILFVIWLVAMVFMLKNLSADMKKELKTEPEKRKDQWLKKARKKKK